MVSGSRLGFGSGWVQKRQMLIMALIPSCLAQMAWLTCVCVCIKQRNESPPRRRRSYLPIPTCVRVCMCMCVCVCVCGCAPDAVYDVYESMNQGGVGHSAQQIRRWACCRRARLRYAVCMRVSLPCTVRASVCGTNGCWEGPIGSIATSGQVYETSNLASQLLHANTCL